MGISSISKNTWEFLLNFAVIAWPDNTGGCIQTHRTKQENFSETLPKLRVFKLSARLLCCCSSPLHHVILKKRLLTKKQIRSGSHKGHIFDFYPRLPLICGNRSHTFITAWINTNKAYFLSKLVQPFQSRFFIDRLNRQLNIFNGALSRLDVLQIARIGESSTMSPSNETAVSRSQCIRENKFIASSANIINHITVTSVLLCAFPIPPPSLLSIMHLNIVQGFAQRIWLKCWDSIYS